MQMSTRAVFIFVEGALDRYLFGRICGAVLPHANYELATATDVPASAGAGKGALLAFYRYLRAAHGLQDSSLDKRTYVLFFVDKDVDDLRGSKARSEHVCFTPYYDIENHLFEDGDLQGCLAAALLISRDDAGAVLGHDPLIWCRNCADQWQRWVAICLCARLLNLQGPATFRRLSQVNEGSFGLYSDVLDAHMMALLVATLPAASVSVERFQATIERSVAIVSRRYARGLHDTVFRGKWYPAFVRRAVTLTRPATSQAQLNGLEDRLVSLLAYAAPVNAAWTASFRDAMTKAHAWTCGAG